MIEFKNFDEIYSALCADKERAVRIEAETERLLAEIRMQQGELDTNTAAKVGDV